MWSRHHNNHNHQKRGRGASSSTSKSYTSNSSSTSSFSSILQPNTRKACRTMEEVWNNITTTHYHQNHYGKTMVAPHHHISTRGTILQDFFAGPIPKETTTTSNTQQLNLPTGLSTMFPPATVLSLNPSEFDFIVGDKVVHDHGQHHSMSTPNNPIPSSPFMTTTPFSDAIGSSGQELLSFCANNKRLPEKPSSELPSEGTGDRRHKRMIKNRESAARSRARKQAYTNELEFEVTHLNQENQKLRKQHEEMRIALAAQALTKKKLHRTSSAPF